MPTYLYCPHCGKLIRVTPGQAQIHSDKEAAYLQSLTVAPDKTTEKNPLRQALLSRGLIWQIRGTYTLSYGGKMALATWLTQSVPALSE